ncbi:transducin beta-like protein TBL1 [Toxoplasma gondii GAB2-2007-GAL-DOM2]|uniref:Transducin beta-like protein TBL1 n=1 Tax=Toxoplasma gondii GAB2-2007-GAL-DOM2 TaxID=1130820 RepID=A0A086KK40_TOXGO|nr:transducin beta-like protein TBL1 [Toxoplasma gondii GAB2-2007-GAL-DOM2]
MRALRRAGPGKYLLCSWEAQARCPLVYFGWKTFPVRFCFRYPPTSLRISGDGSRLAVGTYDSVVHIYALPSLTEVASLIDPHMVIPHITWRSTHDSIAYNVFNMGRTIVAKAEEKPGAAKLEDSV